MNWNEIYNKLFKLINEQGSNYFSGERFISIVQEVSSDFPSYSVYIKQREINGESTTRKDFFRDIFLSLTENQKFDFAKRVEKETHSPLSKSSQELYFLLYGKLPENTHDKSDVSNNFNDFFAELYDSKSNKVFRDMDIAIDSRKVFVVHGRNSDARNAMFRFLRSIGLNPIEWSEAVELTGKPSPYIGEILEAGFSIAQAVLILFTPDDEARLRENFRGRNEPDYEIELTPQARPNVIFEAGMAMGMFLDRTVLVEFGELRPISDISGRHVIRLNNSVARRQELANRLKLAKCAVNLTGTDWHSEGDFEMPAETSNNHLSKSVSKVERPEIIAQPNTRNLRIKKTFSDLEKDEFESNAFEFIADYFQTSLQDLENNNSHIKTRFRKVDTNHFTATVYINDAQANTGSIRLSSDRFLGQGITYSHGRTSGNDISDSLSVVDDGYQLFLKPLGFFNYSNKDKNLTFEEAAEHYWEKFITPLQQ